jgi:hypothetical protein
MNMAPGGLRRLRRHCQRAHQGREKSDQRQLGKGRLHVRPPKPDAFLNLQSIKL